MSPFTQNRKTRRIEKDGKAQGVISTCKAFPALRGKKFQAIVKNVSSNGLLLYLDQPLPPGSIVDWEVTLMAAGKNQRFKLITEIVWCRVLANGQQSAGVRLYREASFDFTVWEHMIFNEIRAREF